MPGTLLLKDLERSNQDELGEHVRSMYGAPSPPPVAPPSTIQTPPPDTMQELGGHLQSLLSGGRNTIGEGLSNVGQGVQVVPQELQTHVQNLLTTTPPPPAPEPTLTPATPVGEPTSPRSGETGPQGSLQDAARAAATAVGVDPEVFARQIQQESGYRTDAVSPAGARGVAQFMPGTGASVAKQMGVSEADFWADPGLQLRGAATHMRDLLGQFGGDYAKALAAYNAGPGNVQKYGGIPPFEETQRYVKTILGGAGEAVKPFVEGAQAAARAVTGESRGDISQFGDAQLTAAEASAACGPAAAVRFAQRFGRNPTLREATNLATEVGWTQNQGMAGIGSEQKLLSRMGVETKLIPSADWGTFANEASTGNPVVISTRGHYFYADNWDRESNRFHVGRSGMDLKGGSEWMTPEQMTGLMGEVQGGLLANNPVTPASTTTRGFASPTAAGAPMAPTPPESEQEQGLTILDDAIDRSVKAPEQRAAAVSRRAPTELIAPPESPQSRLTAQSGDVAGLSGLTGGAEPGVAQDAFQSPAVEGAPGPLERVGSFFEGLGTDVRRQQQESQAQNPYMAGVAGGGFSDLGTAVTSGLERAGVPGYQDFGFEVGPLQVGPREVLGFGSGILPTGAAPAKLAKEGLEEVAPELGVAAGRALRSRLPAEAEAGFAAGMPTGGTRPPRPPIDYEALADMRRQARSAQTELPGTPAADESRLNKEIAASVNNIFAIPSLFTNTIGGVVETIKRPVVTAVSGDVGAAGADLRGMGLAMGDALADVGSTFRTGIRPSRTAAPDIGRGESFQGKDVLTSEAARVGFLRAMSATDEGFRHINSAGEQASRLVQLMREHPTLSQAEVLERFKDDIFKAGEDAAARSVFATGGSGVGEKVAGIRAKVGDPNATWGERGLGALTNVLVPFSSVPDVILTQGAKRLPGINEMVGIAQLRSKDPAVRQRAVASAVLAETINAAILVQALEGNISGNGPTDPDRKQTLMRARDENGEPVWQPNSVRVGGRWIPYSSLGPVAVRMGAIANAVEQIDEESKRPNPSESAFDRITSTAGNIIAGTAETVADAWYLQTVGRLFSALRSGKPQDFVGQQALATGMRAVPYAGELRNIEQFVSPGMSEPRGPIESVAARIPGLSDLASPRIDPATGRPIEEPRDPTGLLLRSVGPGEPSPVNLALAEHNLSVGDPPSTVTIGTGRNALTFPITEDERRRLQQLTGAEVERNVLDFVRDPAFATFPPEDRRRLLEQTISKAREIAGLELAAQIPDAEIDRRYALSEEAKRRQAEPSVRLP
jgi:hypothetical protein